MNRQIALRVLAVICLAVSAYVHLHLAHKFPFPGTISGTTIFRVQGVVAAVVALVLLVTGNKWAWLAGAAVGLASFVAVTLYRYVDVGKIGPLPNMHDPYWLPAEKWISAIAEASVVVIYLIHLATSTRTGERRQAVVAHSGGHA